MYDPDQPIDDTFLELIKKIKALTKVNPHMKWAPNRGVWHVEIEWASQRIGISYSPLHLHKFEVFLYLYDPTIEMAGDCEHVSTCDTVKQVVESLIFLRYLDEGVSNKIVEFLASKCKSMSMKSAITELVKSDIELSGKEMAIIPIPKKDVPRVACKRFGI